VLIGSALDCRERNSGCTIRAHYVNIALGCLLPGTSETAVVVGVKRLFALRISIEAYHPQRSEDVATANW
jgi:hypothetical protein